MEIKDLAWNETLSKRFNNSHFPRNIRGLIVEPFGVKVVHVRQNQFGENRD